MTFSIRQRTLTLALRDPFVIARGSHGTGQTSTTVIVELRSDRYPDLVGIGEGYPDRFYGETPETIAAVLPLLVESLGVIDEDFAAFDGARVALDYACAEAEIAIRNNGAAKCALSIALYDLAGKACGATALELADVSGERPPTDFTLGIDEPSVVAERARRAGRFPALKIKVGGPSDVATLEAVRDVYDGPIRVDANTGWTREGAVALLPDLERLGVELIEQPFPARSLADLGWLQERSNLPIVADESAVFVEDLDALDGVVAGVNVKLAKCGGIHAARDMLTAARERGFRTFLGCMEETTVGIAASAIVAPLADWVDLDGCLLLAADPFEGLVLGDDCRWQLPDGPGLGLRPRGS